MPTPNSSHNALIQQHRCQAQWPIQAHQSNRIAIVGEAPGAEEEQLGVPFVGKAGQELTSMLTEAGIVREQCLVTNVFMDRPPDNNLFAWCSNKKTADELWKGLGNAGKYPFKSLAAGKYLHPSRMVEIKRLHAELVAFDPNLILVLGNTALWAVNGDAGISKLRGTVVECTLLGGTRPYKMLPTYHPAYVIRKWDDRVIAVADFAKAKREAVTHTYTRPKRSLWLEPALADIANFRERHLWPTREFSIDIETALGQITCIGFGTPEAGICVPFVDRRKDGWNYWSTKAEEVQAWQMVRAILAMPQDKILQNGMYDLQWLWRKVGIVPRGTLQDTMLLGHSMFPEMEKSLRFFGSIYTNETAWKNLRAKWTTKDKAGDLE